ncbi:MAG: hypothetical protein ACR2Q3_00695 [Woeseiaceae bacterium]
MKIGDSSESNRGYLAVSVGWLFDRTHPALHWALAPLIFGLVLAVTLCPVFFLGPLVSPGLPSVETGATTILFLFGSASVGGLFGGVLFQMLHFRYDLRLILCWTVSGLVTGLTMAAGLQLLPNHDENNGWVSIFFIVAGLLLGLVMGIGFARAARQDAA